MTMPTMQTDFSRMGEKIVGVLIGAAALEAGVLVSSGVPVSRAAVVLFSEV